MDPRTDAQLVEAFARGGEEAFEVIVNRHGAAVKSYALRLLCSPEEAEEVFEETFIRLVRREGRWEGRAQLRTWLFTVAHRMCVDILRRRQLETRAQPKLVAMAERRRVEPSPEARAALGEEARRLEEALGRLPESHREVLLLRAIHGLSGAETAAVLGIEEGQVHSQLSYARKRLARLLDEGAEAGAGRKRGQT